MKAQETGIFKGKHSRTSEEMKGKEKQSRMVQRNPEEKVANEECYRKVMLRVLSEANCDLHKSSFHDVAAMETR